ncbi:hypothetical protein LFU01_18020 [Lysinibacillus fusiformis]|nr:hypothetical protein LFU01_18020 [Lysinibacillus fusiformis]
MSKHYSGLMSKKLESARRPKKITNNENFNESHRDYIKHLDGFCLQFESPIKAIFLLKLGQT